MGKIIVLRFENKREVGIVKSLMKKGMQDPDLTVPVKAIASGIIEELDKCGDAFDNPDNSGLRVVDDAGVDVETGQYVGDPSGHRDAGDYQKDPVNPKKDYMDKINGPQETK